MRRMRRRSCPIRHTGGPSVRRPSATRKCTGRPGIAAITTTTTAPRRRAAHPDREQQHASSGWWRVQSSSSSNHPATGAMHAARTAGSDDWLAPEEPSLRRSTLILSLLIVSLGFGTMATIALFVRMLERKIKWMTRLIIAGSWLQGIFAMLTFLIFHYMGSTTISGSYSEAVTYNIIASVSSLISAALLTYHHLTSQAQWYSYTMYELSLSQRQLTLLMILSLGYMTLTAGIYSVLEGWVFDDALYWSIVTFSTIGFGDFVPTTITGRFLLPGVTIIGIGLIGGLIWSLRNVVLELLTLQLASQYSKWLSDGQGQGTGSPISGGGAGADARVDMGGTGSSGGGDGMPRPRGPRNRARFDNTVSTSISTGANPIVASVPRVRQRPRPASASDAMLTSSRHASGSDDSVNERTPLIRASVSNQDMQPDKTNAAAGIADPRSSSDMIRTPGHAGGISGSTTPIPRSPAARAASSNPNRSSELYMPSSGLLSTYDNSMLRPASVAPTDVISASTMHPMPRTASSGSLGRTDMQRPKSMAVSPMVAFAVDPSTGAGLADLRLSMAAMPVGLQAALDPGQLPVPLTRAHTTTEYEIRERRRNMPRDPDRLSPTSRPGVQLQQTMTISRSQYLPQVTIVADSGGMATKKLEEATRHALHSQILIGSIMVLTNIVFFGIIFAWLEEWTVWEGFYFAYCAVSTIGYGDYSLCSNVGRSLFI
ncbi:hypothetical protein BC831DRAFT_231495 [Entophlyctis helioformis]|nr:hypothetical protein BC831DRAFT_231495 [Entophlyctis helioformis]